LDGGIWGLMLQKRGVFDGEVGNSW
jgi:hypothetical protein